MRAVLVLAAAATLLAGCENRLSTDSAVIAQPSGPQLKAGLWRVEDNRCPVEESAPTSAWPECAEWLLVEADGRLSSLEGEAKSPRWERRPFLLAGGEVQALQVRDGDGDYSLYGVRARETDGEGRVVRFSRWTIACGPERATGARNADGTREMAVEPSPGVVMTGDKSCRPDGEAGLLAAARADEDTAEVLLTLRWVREVRPRPAAPRDLTPEAADDAGV